MTPEQAEALRSWLITTEEFMRYLAAGAGREKDKCFWDGNANAFASVQCKFDKVVRSDA